MVTYAFLWGKVKTVDFSETIAASDLKVSRDSHLIEYMKVQVLKAYRIKFQKFAAHAHKDALINETFIPT